MNTKELIAQARKYVDREPELSAFIVRDCQEAEDLGLRDLLRLLASGKYGVCRNDVKPILDRLEEYILAQEKGEIE